MADTASVQLRVSKQDKSGIRVEINKAFSIAVNEDTKKTILVPKGTLGSPDIPGEAEVSFEAVDVPSIIVAIIRDTDENGLPVAVPASMDVQLVDSGIAVPRGTFRKFFAWNGDLKFIKFFNPDTANVARVDVYIANSPTP